MTREFGAGAAPPRAWGALTTVVAVAVVVVVPLIVVVPVTENGPRWVQYINTHHVNAPPATVNDAPPAAAEAPQQQQKEGMAYGPEAPALPHHAAAVRDGCT